MFEVGEVVYLNFGSNHHRSNEEVKVIGVIKGSETRYLVEMIYHERDWYGNYRVRKYNVHACEIKKYKVYID